MNRQLIKLSKPISLRAQNIISYLLNLTTGSCMNYVKNSLWLSLLVITTLFTSPEVKAEDPQRIVTLGSSVTQQLFMLGAGNRIVGNTTYCTIPDAANKIEKIGTIRDANVEKILSLQPDIVFATGMTSLKHIQLLKKLGIKVEKILTPQTFDQICSNFLHLGNITGRSNQAKKIVADAKTQIKKLVAQNTLREKPKMFFQIGVKPMFTVTKSYYLNDLIRIAGAYNIAGQASEGIFSREKVIAENPDIIVITTMGLQGEKEREMWKKFSGITAVSNNAIHIVDSEKMCNPNPISFVENLKTMLAIVNAPRQSKR